MDEPKLHLYETGIIRITRHPQMVGTFAAAAALCERGAGRAWAPARNSERVRDAFLGAWA